MKNRIFQGLKLLSLALLLSACRQDKLNSPSQVLARVNGKEITVMQLNYALEQNAGLPQLNQRSKKAVLDDLVQQELLVQLAVEKKLDRNPNVLQAIEFARRQILAQAAIESGGGAVAEPMQDDIDNFYKSHSEFFADRNIYSVDAFILDIAELPKDVFTELDSSHSVAQTESVLKKNSIHFSSSHTLAPAEDFPEKLVNQLKQLKPSDIAVVTEQGKVLLLQLEDIQSSPITLEAARPKIVAYLKSNQMKKKDINAMEYIRKNAKIEIIENSLKSEKSESEVNLNIKTEQHILSGVDGLK